MLTNEDIYTKPNTPTTNVNPKLLGSLWINYLNGYYYICKDNTLNKNVWLDPIGELRKYVDTEITHLANKLNENNYPFGKEWKEFRPVNGVKYSNTTNKYIVLVAYTYAVDTAREVCSLGISINDKVIAFSDSTNTDHSDFSITAVIPPYSTYMCTYQNLSLRRNIPSINDMWYRNNCCFLQLV